MVAIIGNDDKNSKEGGGHEKHCSMQTSWVVHYGSMATDNSTQTIVGEEGDCFLKHDEITLIMSLGLYCICLSTSIF